MVYQHKKSVKVSYNMRSSKEKDIKISAPQDKKDVKNSVTPAKVKMTKPKKRNRVMPKQRRISKLYKSRHNIGNRSATERVGSYRESAIVLYLPDGYWPSVKVDMRKPRSGRTTPKVPDVADNQSKSACIAKVEASQSETRKDTGDASEEKTDKSTAPIRPPTRCTSVKPGPVCPYQSRTHQSGKIISKNDQLSCVLKTVKPNKIHAESSVSAPKAASRLQNRVVGKKQKTVHRVDHRPLPNVKKKRFADIKPRAPRIKRTACLNAGAIVSLMYSKEEPIPRKIHSHSVDATRTKRCTRLNTRLQAYHRKTTSASHCGNDSAVLDKRSKSVSVPKKVRRKRKIREESEDDDLEEENKEEDIPLWPPPKRMASLNAQAILAACREDRIKRPRNRGTSKVPETISKKEPSEKDEKLTEVKDDQMEGAKETIVCPVVAEPPHKQITLTNRIEEQRDTTADDVIVDSEDLSCDLLEKDEDLFPAWMQKDLSPSKLSLKGSSPDVQIVDVEVPAVTPISMATDDRYYHHLTPLEPVQHVMSQPPAVPSPRSYYTMAPPSHYPYQPAPSQFTPQQVLQPQGLQVGGFGPNQQGQIHYQQQTCRTLQYQQTSRHYQTSLDQQLAPPTGVDQSFQPMSNQPGLYGSSQMPSYQPPQSRPCPPPKIQPIPSYPPHPQRPHSKPGYESPCSIPTPVPHLQGRPPSEGLDTPHSMTGLMSGNMLGSADNLVSMGGGGSSSNLGPPGMNTSSAIGNMCTYSYPQSNNGGPPTSHCQTYPIGTMRLDSATGYSVMPYHKHYGSPYALPATYNQPGSQQQLYGSYYPPAGSYLQSLGVEPCWVPSALPLPHTPQPQVKVLVHNSGGQNLGVLPAGNSRRYPTVSDDFSSAGERKSQKQLLHSLQPVQFIQPQQAPMIIDPSMQVNKQIDSAPFQSDDRDIGQRGEATNQTTNNKQHVYSTTGRAADSQKRDRPSNKGTGPWTGQSNQPVSSGSTLSTVKTKTTSNPKIENNGGKAEDMTGKKDVQKVEKEHMKLEVESPPREVKHVRPVLKEDVREPLTSDVSVDNKFISSHKTKKEHENLQSSKAECQQMMQKKDDKSRRKSQEDTAKINVDCSSQHCGRKSQGPKIGAITAEGEKIRDIVKIKGSERKAENASSVELHVRHNPELKKGTSGREPLLRRSIDRGEDAKVVGSAVKKGMSVYDFGGRESPLNKKGVSTDGWEKRTKPDGQSKHLLVIKYDEDHKSSGVRRRNSLESCFKQGQKVTSSLEPHGRKTPLRIYNNEEKKSSDKRRNSLEDVCKRSLCQKPTSSDSYGKKTPLTNCRDQEKRSPVRKKTNSDECQKAGGCQKKMTSCEGLGKKSLNSDNDHEKRSPSVKWRNSTAEEAAKRGGCQKKMISSPEAQGKKPVLTKVGATLDDKRTVTPNNKKDINHGKVASVKKVSVTELTGSMKRSRSDESSSRTPAIKKLATEDQKKCLVVKRETALDEPKRKSPGIKKGDEVDRKSIVRGGLFPAADKPKRRFSAKRVVEKSLSWQWEGTAQSKQVYLQLDLPAVTRMCYSAAKHQDGDVIKVRDCVLVKSGPRKKDIPFVAKIYALYESPEGEKMMSIMWYYRPNQTEMERLPRHVNCELFASRHRDEIPIACVEDKCFVLTLNEYCRYKGQQRRIEQSCPPRRKVVPPATEDQPDPDRIPAFDADPETVYVCRRVYDFKLKRVLKNPHVNVYC